VSEKLEPIHIKPNAKLIGMLKEIAKKGDFDIEKPVLYKNQSIIEKTAEKLLNPIRDNSYKTITIKSNDFSFQNIVESLTLMIKGTPSLVGNFLAVFEDWYFTACDVIPNKINREKIQKTIAKQYYSDFYFDKIKADKNLFNTVATHVVANAVSKKTRDLLIRLGTACYLNREQESLEQAYNILTNTERDVVKQYVLSRRKDLADQILLLVSIIKHHIFRLLQEKTEKKKYYDKVVTSVLQSLKEPSPTLAEKKRQFTVLRHNAYLKALIDAEDYNFDKGRRTAITHGSKAAVTAIMARNLSHNIGSHVLAYLIQELENKIRELEAKIHNLREKAERSEEPNRSKLNSHVKHLKHKQRGMRNHKNLYQYLQHRMDFVAEVTTAGPAWEMSLDFEKDIFPEFGGLKASQDYLPQEIILKYILHSEGIDLSIGNFHLQVDDRCNRISVPDGVVGKHAFYGILENFIRNAAKHYKGPSREGLEIRIELRVPNHLPEKLRSDFIELRIWDMRPSSCRMFEIEENGRKVKKSIVEKLRGFIEVGKPNAALTNDEGELEPGGWGLKEMRVSAAFLRKLDAKELIKKDSSGEEFNPPLLEILCGDPSGKEFLCCSDTPSCRHPEGFQNRLGFRFYLRKPKELLVIAKNATISVNNIFEIEKKEEPDLWKPDDSGLKSEIPHRILLIESGKKNRYSESPHVSCRVMTYDPADDGPIDDEYYLRLYERFIKEEICYDPSYQFPKLVNTLPEPCQFDPHGYSIEWDYKKPDLIYNNIVFQNHPEELNAEEFNLFFEKSHYFQPVSGAYSTRAKLCSISKLSSKLIKKHLYLELLESAMTQVIIVDERVSEWVKNQAFHRMQIRDVLMKMNIFIVNVNKGRVKSAELRSKLLEAQENDKNPFGVFHSEVRKNAHFFVIHLGILNKLDNGAEDLMHSVKCRWKVVDSGRGVHRSEIPQDCKFVEISALQQLLANYDKHGLVQTLFSLRRAL